MPTDPAPEKAWGWHGNGDLCLGVECQVVDADGDHPTADIHSNDWYDGYADGQRDGYRDGWRDRGLLVTAKSQKARAR